jgi:hypothetical protein
MQFVRHSPLLLCAITLALAGCATQNSGGMPSPPSPSSPSGTPTPPTAGKQAPAPAPSPAPGKSSTPSLPSTPSGTAAPPTPPGTSGSPGAPGSAAQSTRTASAEGAGTVDGGKAQTPDERRAAIDRRLEGTLGTFDETLRKEQRTVAEEKDAREASAGGSAESEQTDAKRESEGSEGGSAKPENAPAEASEAGRKADAPARPGDLKSDQGNGGAGTAPKGTGGSAGNIPDGSDDDIVAKRLRKAAEQETDPELKEKLWKEYIDYKKNAGN